MTTFFQALGFLTILPVPRRFGASFDALAVIWFPVVGALIGGLVAAADASMAGLPLTVRSILVVGVWLLVTGALHLDGWIDACDGLAPGLSRERALTAMRDPRAGALGVGGAVVLLGAKWAALGALSQQRALWLIAAAVVARWVVVMLLAFAPSTDGAGGLGAGVARDVRPHHAVVPTVLVALRPGLGAVDDLDSADRHGLGCFHDPGGALVAARWRAHRRRLWCRGRTVRDGGVTRGDWLGDDMNGELELVLGGARSGKSDWAVARAEQVGGDTLFVATAEGLDDDMRARISAHRRSRPQHWVTLEEPIEVASALRGSGRSFDVVVVDCLTLLVSNLLLDPRASDEGIPSIGARVAELCTTLRESARHSILVSNEVGSGIVPEHPISRRFRDDLGAANRIAAREASTVKLLVAGLPLTLKESN